MAPIRPPAHLSKPSTLLHAHPARNLPQSRLWPARTLASTHPPDVAEHPSPETATHESHYDPPSGWYLGVPPGQKYQKEGWENTWVYGFWGSLLLGAVAYAYKPDTSYVVPALDTLGLRRWSRLKRSWGRDFALANEAVEGLRVQQATFAHMTDVPSIRIQTWALEEARRRLEVEGILPDPDDEGKS